VICKVFNVVNANVKVAEKAGRGREVPVLSLLPALKPPPHLANTLRRVN